MHFKPPLELIEEYSYNLIVDLLMLVLHPHDRTHYASDFARPDYLWFQQPIGLAIFAPRMRSFRGRNGQNMLPVPDIFSFTTQFLLWWEP